LTVYIDADACPVTRIAERIAREHGIPVTLLCDTNHQLTSDYSTVKVIGAGADAVDIALINLCHRGDIIVTQDYGVAALALGKGAKAIHQSGRWYTDENIDGLLMERHLAKKARRSGKHHLKGPAKRTEEDDKRFAESFEGLIQEAVKAESREMKIMVSACLLGENCKYNGGNNRNQRLLNLLSGYEIIPFCPEVLGGLPVPRTPAEIVNGTVINRENISVDEPFRQGAKKALEIAKKEKPDLIILQSRSPSCGAKQIYDGTFSGKLIPGHGVFAELALRSGFPVMDVEDAVASGLSELDLNTEADKS
jgi:hypothetical protein